MSTDFQVLNQKFNNFKVYIKSVSSNDSVIRDYENMSDNEFLLFGLGFLVPNKEKLDIVLEQICSKLKITDQEQRDKIKRYLECFIEYLIQIKNPSEILKETIINLATEKNIKIPESPKLNL